MYIYIYTYIYIYISKKPILLYVTAVNIKKLHIFSYRYISELYSFVSVCACERYMLKIKYLLQIYNKRIVKTNQGKNMKT